MPADLPELAARIREAVESSREELAILLQRLIRIRSYDGQEKEIVTLVRSGSWKRVSTRESMVSRRTG